MSRDLVPVDKATVALLDEVERVLAGVEKPEDADELRRKITAVGKAAELARAADDKLVAIYRLRLRVKRRWGELLGEAENRGPATVTRSHGSTAADRKQAERARRLAEVPESVFAAYLEHEDPSSLSEAGLTKMVRQLQRLDFNPALRQRAWDEALRRAETDGRPVALGDVKPCVEHWLPTEPEESQPEPKQVGTPSSDPVEQPSPPAATQVEELATYVGRLPKAVAALQPRIAAQERPSDIEKWRVALSAARDTLDSLIEALAVEQAVVEAATPEQEAEAERIAAKFRESL